MGIRLAGGVTEDMSAHIAASLKSILNAYSVTILFITSSARRLTEEDSTGTRKLSGDDQVQVAAEVIVDQRQTDPTLEEVLSEEFAPTLARSLRSNGADIEDDALAVINSGTEAVTASPTPAPGRVVSPLW